MSDSTAKTTNGALHLPAALIIMDGFGIAEPGPGNAISLAKTPNLDAVFSSCPYKEIHASEQQVGLPKGQMGNSEVGHLNIGAGRIIFQELTRIDNACEDGSLAENSVLLSACETAKAPDAVLHLMGLLSDGGVHSHNAHLYALMKLAVETGVSQVYVHCFLDGRDVPPSSAADYLKELQVKIDEIATENTVIEIGSIMGRYYAMDRDNRWERVVRGYDAIVCAEPNTNSSVDETIATSYAHDITDEFVEPIAFQDRGVLPQDAIIFFNFRPDRAREITRSIVDKDFDGFDRQQAPFPYFVCMTEYADDIEAPVAFAKEFPENVLADVLSSAGLRQYHIAETEKYAHVTFFMNGGIEAPKAGESRTLIPSPKVATYDLQPEMSEPEVADTLAAAIRNNEADVYIVNFANCDMVGHTGSIPAAIAAVEAVDDGVGKVLAAIRDQQGIAFVTADHGNADKMLAEDGTPHTAHTTALVPFALVDCSGQGLSLADGEGALCNIAPTLLEAIGLEKPVEMTATSMLAK